MANINLLPWREDRRRELKTEFLTVLCGVVIMGVALTILASTIVDDAISHQAGRNNYLQAQIDELSFQVKEIKELKKKKRELLDRMKVIQDLQGNRPIIVRIFDEMVRTLPDGIFYSDLKRTDNTVRLTGIAESNNRISSLMRRLDGSEWFANPNLTAVEAQSDYGEQASEFGLSFNISTPSITEKE